MYLDEILNEELEKYITANLQTLAEEYQKETSIEAYFTIREWEKNEREEKFMDWAKLEFEETNKPL